MSSSSYTVPPPGYVADAPAAKKPAYGAVEADAEAQAPLLGAAAQAPPQAANAIWRQPDDVGGIDDFNYGVNVWESSPEIKNAFIRKVYTILFAQVLATCIVGGAVSQSTDTQLYIRAHPWTLFLPFVGSLVNLGLLHWKRHSHPWNYVLLSTFTAFEAFTIGIFISFYDQMIVLEALLITLGVFIGLTLFTLQSKYDFSGIGPFLFAGLLTLIFSGFVSMFFPMNSVTERIYGIIGALLFSGFVVYDTYEITKRLSPDEYIAAAISLYLDFINLFLSILRVMGAGNRD